MTENNTSNKPSATPSAAGANRKIIISASVCLALVVIFLALFFGSVSLYRKAAANGNREAQFTLGMHYRYGLGVKKDKIRAWELWRMAAEQDLKTAQNKLAEIHKEIEMAATAGNASPRVQLVWGSCLVNGWGPQKDMCEGWLWWLKAAEQNYDPAKQKFADFQKDIETAANADNADPRAQFIRGVCLINGWGTAKDEKEAWTRWWKASARNFEPAKARLANAMKDIEAAAKADNADAGTQLAWGMCLNNGWGPQQNEAEALVWLNKAGESVPAIQYELGLSYGRGIGVKKDEKTAFDWFSKAAGQGYAEAQYELALCFLNGKGVDKNEMKAYEWLVSAAVKSNSARKDLVNNQQNIEKAAKAENADANALLIWGKCLDNGWGPKKDKAAAFEWFKKAAEKGNAEAKAIVEQRKKEEAEKKQKEEAEKKQKEEAEKKQKEEAEKKRKEEAAAAAAAAPANAAETKAETPKPEDAPKAEAPEQKEGN